MSENATRDVFYAGLITIKKRSLTYSCADVMDLVFAENAAAKVLLITPFGARLNLT